MRGLRAYILRGDIYAPGASDAPTVHATRVTIVGYQEYGEKYPVAVPPDARVFEPDAEAPPVILHWNTRDHVRAVPLNLDGTEHPGWHMASGAYIETNDGRFHELTGHPYPVPLHDRTE